MMEIEHIATKQRFTVTWWAGNMKMEWYGFKKVKINDKTLPNVWEGYVMNNVAPECDEFGDIDICEINKIPNIHFAMGKNLNEIMPPVGFRRVK